MPVAHLPDLTQGLVQDQHSSQYRRSSWSVVSWMPVNCTVSLCFLSSLQRLGSFQFLLENFCQ